MPKGDPWIGMIEGMNRFMEDSLKEGIDDLSLIE